jgi:hypothetical protein
MRFNGHNVLAIILAAIVIYLLEFVIFAVLMTPEQYTAMSGYQPAADAMSRMPMGALPPILTAIGLSLAIKWRGKSGLVAGLATGALLGLLFGFSGSLYSYVYGPNTLTMVSVSLGHFVVCWGLAGAVLGAWR